MFLGHQNCFIFKAYSCSRGVARVTDLAQCRVDGLSNDGCNLASVPVTDGPHLKVTDVSGTKGYNINDFVD